VELLEFTCPVCHEAFHAPLSLAGESAACPRCSENIDCWPHPIKRGSRPASPSKPATSSPNPAKSSPLPSPPDPLPSPPASLPIPAAPTVSEHGSPRVWWGIGIGLGLILVVVASFVIGRNLAARLGGQNDDTSPVAPGDSGGSQASDRAMADRIIITAFPVSSGVPGGYWFTFWVSTTDPTKNAQFVAWSDNAGQIPAMTDDIGNQYKAFVPLANPNDASTQLLATDQLQRLRKLHSLEPQLHKLQETLPASLNNGSGSITSQAARGDLIGYQPIVPAANKLYLTLPAENVGGSGVIHFEFHVERLEKMFAQKK
jgi:hypothetical protein